MRGAFSLVTLVRAGLVMSGLVMSGPVTSAEAPEPIAAVPRPWGAMAATRDHFWVASCQDRGLVGIGLVSSRVEIRAATGLADPAGELVLAATEHGVWVVSDEAGFLASVDPATGMVRARIRVKCG